MVAARPSPVWGVSGVMLTTGAVGPPFTTRDCTTLANKPSPSVTVTVRVWVPWLRSLEIKVDVPAESGAASSKSPSRLEVQFTDRAAATSSASATLASKVTGSPSLKVAPASGADTAMVGGVETATLMASVQLSPSSSSTVRVMVWESAVRASVEKLTRPPVVGVMVARSPSLSLDKDAVSQSLGTSGSVALAAKSRVSPKVLTDPSAGAVMAQAGCWFSAPTVTTTVSVAVWAAESVTVRLRTWSPSVRVA